MQRFICASITTIAILLVVNIPVSAAAKRYSSVSVSPAGYKTNYKYDSSRILQNDDGDNGDVNNCKKLCYNEKNSQVSWNVLCATKERCSECPECSNNSENSTNDDYAYSTLNATTEATDDEWVSAKEWIDAKNTTTTAPITDSEQSDNAMNGGSIETSNNNEQLDIADNNESNTTESNVDTDDSNINAMKHNGTSLETNQITTTTNSTTMNDIVNAADDIADEITNLTKVEDDFITELEKDSGNTVASNNDTGISLSMPPSNDDSTNNTLIDTKDDTDADITNLETNSTTTPMFTLPTDNKENATKDELTSNETNNTIDTNVTTAAASNSISPNTTAVTNNTAVNDDNESAEPALAPSEIDVINATNAIKMPIVNNSTTNTSSPDTYLNVTEDGYDAITNAITNATQEIVANPSNNESNNSITTEIISSNSSTTNDDNITTVTSAENVTDIIATENDLNDTATITEDNENINVTDIIGTVNDLNDTATIIEDNDNVNVTSTTEGNNVNITTSTEENDIVDNDDVNATITENDNIFNNDVNSTTTDDNDNDDINATTTSDDDDTITDVNENGNDDVNNTTTVENNDYYYEDAPTDGNATDDYYDYYNDAPTDGNATDDYYYYNNEPIDETLSTSSHPSSKAPTPQPVTYLPTKAPTVRSSPPSSTLPTQAEEGMEGLLDTLKNDFEMVENEALSDEMRLQQILAGASFLVAIFLMVFTAWQVQDNNAGCCAALCRLCVSAIGCCCRLIFWPCTRRSASRGGGTGSGRGKRGERREKVSDQDWSEMMSSGHDLELT